MTKAGQMLATVRIQREAARRVARIVDGKPQWVYEPTERLVFTGAASGEHSIDLSVSSLERVRAHWDGYLQANGIRRTPAVGELVEFPSRSAPGGWRMGRVTSVGPRRLTIEYRFNYGRKTTKTIPHHECWFSA